jgi:hypothetical protein
MFATWRCHRCSGWNASELHCHFCNHHRFEHLVNTRPIMADAPAHTVR